MSTDTTNDVDPDMKKFFQSKDFPGVDRHGRIYIQRVGGKVGRAAIKDRQYLDDRHAWKKHLIQNFPHGHRLIRKSSFAPQQIYLFFPEILDRDLLGQDPKFQYSSTTTSSCRDEHGNPRKGIKIPCPWCKTNEFVFFSHKTRVHPSNSIIYCSTCICENIQCTGDPSRMKNDGIDSLRHHAFYTCEPRVMKMYPPAIHDKYHKMFHASQLNNYHFKNSPQRRRQRQRIRFFSNATLSILAIVMVCVLPIQQIHLNIIADLNYKQQTSATSMIAKRKLLIFITTVFSKQHQDYFQSCWPQLMKHSKLFPNADIMIFSNNETVIGDTVIKSTRNLFRKNPRLDFQFPSRKEFLHPIHQFHNSVNKFQYGAEMGLRLAVQNGWFHPYEWVIRINPDVLIRNSTFIVEKMKDPTVDAILYMCAHDQVHTDFFAIRPKILKQDAFRTMVVNPRWQTFDHETSAYKAFNNTLHSNKVEYLPDMEDSQGFCRMRGPKAPVYHWHDSFLDDSMVCNALVGWDVI